MSIADLRSSTKKIGQLYPVLIDFHGNIIDGEHRSRSDENWKKIRLEHVKTEKDLLIARIVSNNVRRTVSRREKTRLLDRLGQVYVKETEPGEIAYRIAEDTGMSYTWVMKYLPDRFKDSLQAKRAARSATQHVTGSRILYDILKPPLNSKALKIHRYNNTDFVSLTLELQFYQQFENTSKKLGLPVEFCILRALEHYQGMMNLAIAARA
jgi:hypothetical protein